jgi:hypothetical protein
MILIFIVLTVCISRLNFAIPIICDGICPNNNYNSDDILSPNDQKGISLTEKHPVFNLMKVLGEENVKKVSETQLK